MTRNCNNRNNTAENKGFSRVFTKNNDKRRSPNKILAKTLKCYQIASLTENTDHVSAVADKIANYDAEMVSLWKKNLEGSEVLMQ